VVRDLDRANGNVEDVCGIDTPLATDLAEGVT
jgi:hypothetical protein